MHKVHYTVYFELHDITQDQGMIEFARQKIPGFNLSRGFGYYECKTGVEAGYGLEIEPNMKFMLVSQVSLVHLSYLICHHIIILGWSAVHWSRCLSLC